jgi:succinate dehydrogenase / fumarate reductase membrane anchor subunit
VKKAVTGSHSGTGWWLAQRVSAVVILLAGGTLLAGYWLAAPFDFVTWHSAFQATWTKLLVWLLVASLCLHAWAGLRDVLMDYVKPLVLRLALDVLVTLVLIMSVVWVSMILWSVYG